MIELQYKKGITSPLHRCMVLVLLLCSFALGVKAQESWWPEGTHPTGIDNGVVYLNDLEDHNWTYYSGVDRSVDNGYYNDNYNGKLYSPNPRNVMITYQGVNNVEGSTTKVKVSIDEGEDQSTFVYYKTLEPGNNEGEYPYTVISNPFSVRPSVVKNGTKTYYGFNGWKIVSGGEYIKNYDNNQILPLDAEIVFENLPYSSVNSISANIVFQTTWVTLNNIVRLTNTTTESYTYTAEGGTYETNILVLQTNLTQHIVADSPCTVMMVEPDGSNDYRNYTFNKLLRPAEGVNNRTKIEFIHWQPSGAINARGRNFTIGRGIVMDGTTRAVYGTSTAGTVEEPLAVNQILKVESGKYLKFENYGATPTEIQKQCVIFGCDYDRANEDNSKLGVEKKMCIAYSTALPDNLTDNSEICRVYSLSGSFVTEELVGNAEHTSSYYFNVGGSASAKKGYRYLEILGGEWKNIVGGWGPEHPTDQPAFIFRMKGGDILGSIYGAAQYEAAKGTCTFVITGGTINGWIAGGANGTKEDKGDLDGESFIYVGGNARIDSDGSDDVINRAVGGNVFGAGCGYNASSTSGQVTLGTNVVIADNAYVERGVYGGGSYGYCPTDKTANIYITGGTVGGKAGGVNGTSYQSDIEGGVYGGACQNKGGNVNIYMTGGMVNGGLYGGSNASGTLSGNVNVKITGGTIGGIVNGNQANANVYGGGYGSGTAVNGAVSMTLENSGASTGVTVNGDVYGGGAEGKVNNSISINVNAANINGDLYGGGHGASAEVSGNSAITMTGGTIGNVFGGGNAAKLIGNSSVTITDGTVTSNVYGGGNQAEVKGQTKVVVGKNR